MKTLATILLLAAVLFMMETARASDNSLELVLIDERVVFATANNISMEMIFRNVGETNLSPAGLLVGLSIVIDGKEFKRHRVPSLNILLAFEPKNAWRTRFSFSDFLIPPEALTSGRHTIALRDMNSESNTQTIFVEPQK
jgi:hypothetical protein